MTAFQWSYSETRLLAPEESGRSVGSFCTSRRLRETLQGGRISVRESGHFVSEKQPAERLPDLLMEVQLLTCLTFALKIMNTEITEGTEGLDFPFVNLRIARVGWPLPDGRTRTPIDPRFTPNGSRGCGWGHALLISLCGSANPGTHVLTGRSRDGIV